MDGMLKLAPLLQGEADPERSPRGATWVGSARAALVFVEAGHFGRLILACRRDVTFDGSNVMRAACAAFGCPKPMCRETARGTDPGERAAACALIRVGEL